MRTPASPPDQGLILEACLPLDWQPLAEPLARPEAASLARDNLDMLRIVSALEATAADAGEEGGEGNAAELARLDFKLNLLLDMVGQLLARDLTLPASRSLTLTPFGLHWRDFDAPPPVGSLVRLRLWLSGRYPRPLVLPGRVEQAAAGQDEAAAVTVRFQDLGGTLAAALERYIFVQHRRHMARRRRR